MSKPGDGSLKSDIENGATTRVVIDRTFEAAVP
jgi:hypothetical protein